MASDLDAARETIESRIKTQWEAGLNTTIVWPDVATPPPESGAYIEPDIIWGDGFISTKNGRNEIVGLIAVNVYAPTGSGAGTAYATADAVRDMLNRVEVAGVRFQAPSGPRPIPSAGSRWTQYQISVGFTVEEVVT